MEGKGKLAPLICQTIRERLCVLLYVGQFASALLPKRHLFKRGQLTCPTIPIFEPIFIRID